MTKKARRKRALRRTDAEIFRQMREGDFDRLSETSTAIECSRNCLPLNGLDLDKTLLIVGSGILGLQHTLSDGRTSLTELFQAGDLLDLRRNGRSFQGDLICLSKSRLCALSAAVLDDIAMGDPAINAALQMRQREQMHSLRDHCVDIGKKTPNERVASFIFEQMNSEPGSSPRRGFVEIKISQKALGEYLGLRSETISRSFAFLQSMGMVSFLGRGKFCVVDFFRLRAIANGSMPRSPSGSDAPRPIADKLVNGISERARGKPTFVAGAKSQPSWYASGR